MVPSAGWPGARSASPWQRATREFCNVNHYHSYGCLVPIHSGILETLTETLTPKCVQALTISE